MSVRTRRRQSGYLFGVPILLAMMGVAIAILVPKLSSAAGKTLIITGAIAGIGGLYYMIVVPGWLPARRAGMGRVTRCAVFVALAILIAIAVGTFVIVG